MSFVKHCFEAIIFSPFLSSTFSFTRTHFSLHHSIHLIHPPPAPQSSSQSLSPPSYNAQSPPTIIYASSYPFAFSFRYLFIPFYNHKITQIFTRNLFLERKALPTTFLPSVKTLTKNILLVFLLAQVFFL